MQLDVSFLPAYGAAFILMFARIGTMIMLLPGLGEMSVPARIRLTIALLLTFVLFPLHRAGYTIDLRSPGPVIIALGQELAIGMVLGLTARLTISALRWTRFGGWSICVPRCSPRQALPPAASSGSWGWWSLTRYARCSARCIGAFSPSSSSWAGASSSWPTWSRGRRCGRWSSRSGSSPR